MSSQHSKDNNAQIDSTKGKNNARRPAGQKPQPISDALKQRAVIKVEKLFDEEMPSTSSASSIAILGIRNLPFSLQLDGQTVCPADPNALTREDANSDRYSDCDESPQQQIGVTAWDADMEIEAEEPQSDNDLRCITNKANAAEETSQEEEEDNDYRHEMAEEERRMIEMDEAEDNEENATGHIRAEEQLHEEEEGQMRNEPDDENLKIPAEQQPTISDLNVTDEPQPNINDKTEKAKMKNIPLKENEAVTDPRKKMPNYCQKSRAFAQNGTPRSPCHKILIEEWKMNRSMKERAEAGPKAGSSIASCSKAMATTPTQTTNPAGQQRTESAVKDTPSGPGRPVPPQPVPISPEQKKMPAESPKPVPPPNYPGTGQSNPPTTRFPFASSHPGAVAQRPPPHQQDPNFTTPLSRGPRQIGVAHGHHHSTDSGIGIISPNPHGEAGTGAKNIRPHPNSNQQSAQMSPATSSNQGASTPQGQEVVPLETLLVRQKSRNANLEFANDQLKRQLQQANEELIRCRSYEESHNRVKLIADNQEKQLKGLRADIIGMEEQLRQERIKIADLEVQSRANSSGIQAITQLREDIRQLTKDLESSEEKCKQLEGENAAKLEANEKKVNAKWRKRMDEELRKKDEETNSRVRELETELKAEKQLVKKARSDAKKELKEKNKTKLEELRTKLEAQAAVDVEKAKSDVRMECAEEVDGLKRQLDGLKRQMEELRNAPQMPSESAQELENVKKQLEVCQRELEDVKRQLEECQRDLAEERKTKEQYRMVIALGQAGVHAPSGASSSSSRPPSCQPPANNQPQQRGQKRSADPRGEQQTQQKQARISSPAPVKQPPRQQQSAFDTMISALAENPPNSASGRRTAESVLSPCSSIPPADPQPNRTKSEVAAEHVEEEERRAVAVEGGQQEQQEEERLAEAAVNENNDSEDSDVQIIENDDDRPTANVSASTETARTPLTLRIRSTTSGASSSQNVPNSRVNASNANEEREREEERQFREEMAREHGCSIDDPKVQLAVQERNRCLNLAAAQQQQIIKPIPVPIPTNPPVHGSQNTAQLQPPQEYRILQQGMVVQEQQQQQPNFGQIQAQNINVTPQQIQQWMFQQNLIHQFQQQQPTFPTTFQQQNIHQQNIHQQNMPGCSHQQQQTHHLNMPSHSQSLPNTTVQMQIQHATAGQEKQKRRARKQTVGTAPVQQGRNVQPAMMNTMGQTSSGGGGVQHQQQMASTYKFHPNPNPMLLQQGQQQLYNQSSQIQGHFPRAGQQAQGFVPSGQFVQQQPQFPVQMVHQRPPPPQYPTSSASTFQSTSNNTLLSSSGSSSGSYPLVELHRLLNQTIQDQQLQQAQQQSQHNSQPQGKRRKPPF